MLEGVVHNSLWDNHAKTADNFDDHLASQNAPIRHKIQKIETKPHPYSPASQEATLDIGRINNIQWHMGDGLQAKMTARSPSQRTDKWTGERYYTNGTIQLDIFKEGSREPHALRDELTIFGDTEDGGTVGWNNGNNFGRPYTDKGKTNLTVSYENPAILTGYVVRHKGDKKILHFYASENPNFFEDRELNAPRPQPVEPQVTQSPHAQGVGEEFQSQLAPLDLDAINGFFTQQEHGHTPARDPS
jgi:hypothetical protein